jgi:hypothetical protein
MLRQNSLVKTGPDKPLQAFTRVYKAISLFFKNRNIGTKVGWFPINGAWKANMPPLPEAEREKNESASLGKDTQASWAANRKHPQALARIGKDKQA